MAGLLLLVCLGLLAYVHAGYPLLMALLARHRPRPLNAGAAPAEGLSVVLCVHNAAERIQDRLRNLRACRWPGDLDIVVFCDGCTDGTAERIAALADPGVRVLSHPQQRGKASALNEAIPACRHALVVLCDARQDFHPDALRHLAAPFTDPQVGAVSGLLEIAPSKTGGGQGVDLYWKLERKLREWEGRHDSVIGCTGAICAIRRDLFEPLRPDTILDDVVVPMRILAAGRRVFYEPQAVAWDPQALDPALEQRRKLRTLAGNYQLIEHFPEWLLPGGNRLWWALLSHKYLRLAVPWLLIATALLSLLAPPSPWIRGLQGAQLLAYGAALTGLLRPGWRFKAVTVPAGFLLLQLACLRAFAAYLQARRDALRLWQPTPLTGR